MTQQQPPGANCDPLTLKPPINFIKAHTKEVAKDPDQDPFEVRINPKFDPIVGAFKHYQETLSKEKKTL